MINLLKQDKYVNQNQCLVYLCYLIVKWLHKQVLVHCMVWWKSQYTVADSTPYNPLPSMVLLKNAGTKLEFSNWIDFWKKIDLSNHQNLKTIQFTFSHISLNTIWYGTLNPPYLLQGANLAKSIELSQQKLLSTFFFIKNVYLSSQ